MVFSPASKFHLKVHSWPKLWNYLQQTTLAAKLWIRSCKCLQDEDFPLLVQEIYGIWIFLYNGPLCFIGTRKYNHALIWLLNKTLLFLFIVIPISFINSYLDTFFHIKIISLCYVHGVELVSIKLQKSQDHVELTGLPKEPSQIHGICLSQKIAKKSDFLQQNTLGC